mmetsp:Transcript_29910/g.41095  ORF Transcript_29910/g.41095 Transcript_29910/m.41095 type:complete len:283 (+) Transcript_29910:386-1234(+)
MQGIVLWLDGQQRHIDMRALEHGESILQLRLRGELVQEAAAQLVVVAEEGGLAQQLLHQLAPAAGGRLGGVRVHQVVDVGVLLDDGLVHVGHEHRVQRPHGRLLQALSGRHVVVGDAHAHRSLHSRPVLFCPFLSLLLAEAQQCSLHDVGPRGEAREEDVGAGPIRVPHVVDDEHRVLAHARVPEPVRLERHVQSPGPADDRVVSSALKHVASKLLGEVILGAESQSGEEHHHVDGAAVAGSGRLAGIPIQVEAVGLGDGGAVEVGGGGAIVIAVPVASRWG